MMMVIVMMMMVCFVKLCDVCDIICELLMIMTYYSYDDDDDEYDIPFFCLFFTLLLVPWCRLLLLLCLGVGFCYYCLPLL